MKTVSNGGDLSKNVSLQAACSVNAKEADATAFKLPTTSSIKLKLIDLDLKKVVKKLDSVVVQTDR